MNKTFWAVLCVVGKGEQVILDDLKKMGVKAYVPFGSRITKPKNKHSHVVVKFPVFSGYVFVYFPRKGVDARHIVESRGVIDFIYMDGQIGKISNHNMRAIQLAEKQGAFNIRRESETRIRQSFREGDVVALSGLSGWKQHLNDSFGKVIEDTNGKAFATVMIGNNLKLKISVDFLVQIGR